MKTRELKRRLTNSYSLLFSAMGDMPECSQARTYVQAVYNELSQLVREIENEHRIWCQQVLEHSAEEEEIQ